MLVPRCMYSTPPYPTTASLALAQLVQDIRHNGHRIAQLDPLQRATMGPWASPQSSIHPSLTAQPLATLVQRLRALGTLPDEQEAFLANHLGLAGAKTAANTATTMALIEDLITPLHLHALYNTMGSIPTKTTHPLTNLIQALLSVYCRTLAVEAGHMSCAQQRAWVADAVEAGQATTREQRRHTLRALVHADILERFLAARFPSSKRFGVEGCEVLIPGLLGLCAAFAERGGQRVELAMAHR